MENSPIHNWDRGENLSKWIFGFEFPLCLIYLQRLCSSAELRKHRRSVPSARAKALVSHVGEVMTCVSWEDPPVSLRGWWVIFFWRAFNMDVQSISKILEGIRLELVWTIVLSAVALYFFILIKDFLTTLLYYHQFKSNDNVSLGTMVEVNGFIGRIKSFGLTYIIIEGEKGYYRIPMNSWPKHNWVFLRTEWKKDTTITRSRLGLRHDDDIKFDHKLFIKLQEMVKEWELKKK